MSLARIGWGMMAAGAALFPLALIAGYAYGGAPGAISAGSGAVLATLSALGGLALLVWAYRRSSRHFLGAVAGGFLGRMILFTAAVAVLAGGTDLPALPFVGGLFFYYVLFQALEIWALHRARAGAPSMGER